MTRERLRHGILWLRFFMLMLIIVWSVGCVSIPPILQQASWLVSSVSYLTTSKGPSDHAISGIAKKDCSLFRLLLLKPMCMPITDETNRSLWSRLINKTKKITPQEPLEPPDIDLALNRESTVPGLLDISQINMSLIVVVQP